ncbi:MAG: hypothetical protein WCD21_41340 [Streptomyces sp.]
MSTILTADQRVARLREQLSGADGAYAQTHSARRLRESPAANALIGVALRGAARREQGLELTALEQRLTDQLGALFGPATLAEFGRIYQEPASLAGAASLFPAAVVERPLKEGLDTNDVLALLPQVQEEIADLDSVRQISVEELGAGVLTGQEEVVVVTGAPVEGTEFEVEAIHEARVRYVQFRCDQKSDEVGDDEIYWMSAAAGDSKAQIVVLTPEYGGVKTGTVSNFGSDAYWFKGAAEKFAAGHISVWEADHSSPNQVRQVLADIARNFAVAALEDGPGFDAALLAVVAITTALVGWIMSLNKDDFIAQQNIAYTRAALARLAGTNNGQFNLIFDGGNEGKHTLTMEASFGPVIAAGLNHSIYYNGQWSTPVHIPHLVAATRASMATHNGVLYAAYVDVNRNIQITGYNGEHWSKPLTAAFRLLFEPVPVPARALPAVCATLLSDRGQLLLLWRDSDTNKLRLASVDPKTAELTPRHDSNRLLFDPPVFLTHNGVRTLMYVTFDMPRVLVNSATDYTWADSQLPAIRGMGEVRPAAVSYKGRLWAWFGHPNGMAFEAWSTPAVGEAWVKEPEKFAFMGVMAPSAAVAASGAYTEAEEQIVCISAPMGSIGIRPIDTRVFNQNGPASPATHQPAPDLEHGADIAVHDGTLHRLYW